MDMPSWEQDGKRLLIKAGSTTNHWRARMFLEKHPLVHTSIPDSTQCPTPQFLHCNILKQWKGKQMLCPPHPGGPVEARSHRWCLQCAGSSLCTRRPRDALRECLDWEAGRTRSGCSSRCPPCCGSSTLEGERKDIRAINSFTDCVLVPDRTPFIYISLAIFLMVHYLPIIEAIRPLISYIHKTKNRTQLISSQLFSNKPQLSKLGHGESLEPLLRQRNCPLFSLR